MKDASLGVQAALQATGEMKVVLNSAFPGWGLTTDRVAGWCQHLVATYHPQIVIGTWSWDDTEAADTPSLYEQRLQAALRALLAPGDGVEAVILLQFPQTGPVPAITNSPPATPLTSTKPRCRTTGTPKPARPRGVPRTRLCT